MYGLLVFSAEVDDRGIDFVAKTLSGKYHDVQVKIITGYNYTYVTESKFSETLLICLVVLNEGLCPDALYLKLTGKKPEDIFPALRDQPTDA